MFKVSLIREFSNTKKLILGINMDVLEIFSSFQGEGPFVGTPATFLRLAGCNLNCEWCDTDLTEIKEMSLKSVKEIISNEINNYNINLLVITGGEPSLQLNEISNLIELLPNNLDIQIESNGFKKFSIEKDIDYVISPKKNKEEVFARYCEYDNVYFKFVISSQKDIDEIIFLKNKYKYNKTIWLQPEFNHDIEMANLIVDNFDKLKNIKISAQTHKYLNQQ